jgi:hypothetical protein
MLGRAPSGSDADFSGEHLILDLAFEAADEGVARTLIFVDPAFGFEPVIADLAGEIDLERAGFRQNRHFGADLRAKQVVVVVVEAAGDGAVDPEVGRVAEADGARTGKEGQVVAEFVAPVRFPACEIGVVLGVKPCAARSGETGAKLPGVIADRSADVPNCNVRISIALFGVK